MIPRILGLVRQSALCSFGLSFLYIFAVNLLPVESATEEQLRNISLRLYLGKTVNDSFRDALVGDVAQLVGGMDLQKPTVIYIHGFTENLDRTSVHTVVGGYLERGDHNVLAVDWSQIAGEDYVSVATNAPGAGGTIARALDVMVDHSVNASSIHIVGHSMGGEVAGYIGRSVNFTLSRITGLDPAGPGFYIIVEHLNSADAEFVDVIHTDGGFYGYGYSMGHVDFYPNGGSRVQPGCPLWTMPFSDDDFCSHHRSWLFYAESLNNEKAFIGVKCSDKYQFFEGKCRDNGKTIMGIATPSTARGSLYLTTNSNSPYGRGGNGVKPYRRST